MRGLDWDDLRIFHAVAEHGSLNAAAKVLHVNHTTVLRRIGAFEDQLGVRLFERLPSGYVLTPAGEELLAAASGMADTVAAVERKVKGQDLRLEGELRVTTTDSLGMSILPAILKDFHRAYPGITVELATTNVFVNLTRRAADIAIRPTNDPPDTLVGRKVATIRYAVYATKRMAAGFNLKQPATHPWVMLDQGLADTTAGKWLRSTCPNLAPVLRADSFVSLREAARAGIGVALLPCYLGDTNHDLARAWAPIPGLTTDLWLLTHEDLRRTARIKAFMDHVGSALIALRSLISGVP